MELGGTLFRFPSANQLHKNWEIWSETELAICGCECLHTIVGEPRIEHLADHEDV
jgi:hypothetical protein